MDTIVRLSNAGGSDGVPRQGLPDVLPHSYMEAFETTDADPNHLLMVREQNQTVVGTFHLTFLTYLAGAGKPGRESLRVHPDVFFVMDAGSARSRH